MKLSPGEERILESNSGILTLTSHRIRIERRLRGRSSLTSWTLDAVESCGLVTRRRPGLFYLAMFFGIIGVYNVNQGPSSGLPFVGLAALVAGVFIVWRSNLLVLSSRSGPVYVPIHGMKNEDVVDFIDTLEAAKLRFIGVRA